MIVFTEKVCYYRHVLGSFAPIPSHCNVVVELDGRWYLLDSATVDTIDGILELKIGMWDCLLFSKTRFRSRSTQWSAIPPVCGP